MTDADLLEQISGDPEGAMELILDAYGPDLRGRLMKYASGKGLGSVDVDDVLQEGIIALLDPDIRQEVVAAGGEILPWLSRRGYWRLQDGARRRVKAGDGQLEDAMQDSLPDSEAVAVSSASEAVRTCFPQLSPRDQDLLRMHYEENLTIAQIAERTGLGPGTAKKATHDARTRMKRLLLESDGAPEGVETR